MFDVQEHLEIGLLVVRGSVSVYEAAELRDVLRAVTLRNKVTLVDLTSSDFIDATALGVLVGALKAARAAGVRLELVVPDRESNIRKILRITGIGKLFTLHNDVTLALRRHGVEPNT